MVDDTLKYRANSESSVLDSFSNNYEVVRALRAGGYNVQELRSGDYSGLNILSPRQNPGRMEKLLGIAGIKFGPAAFHLGTLWLDNKEKGTGDSTWVLESNGSAHIARISTLITELLEGKDVSVDVKLSKDSPNLVRLPKSYSLN